MNYYEHHLGDYLRDTAHLSMLEDGAYRRLIDAYYIREAPLPNALRDVCRLVRAQTKQDREAVETALREFFAESPDGWRHRRCEREIERYQDKQRKAKASAAARWERKPQHSEGNANASPDAMRTHSEGNAPRARPQTPDTRHHLSSKAARGEASQAPPRASRIPPDWTPGPEGLAFAATLGFANGRADNEVAKFRDFWSGKAGKDGAKLDWPATWRNWLRRSVEHGAASQRTPAAASDPFAGAL